MPEFIAVDGDPFAQGSPQNGGPLRITVTPGQPNLVPVDHDPFATSGPSYAGDIAKAIPSGLAKGAIDLAGLPDTISQLWAAGGDKLIDAMEYTLGLPKGWAEETKGFIRQGRVGGAMGGLPSAKSIRQTVEQNITGPLYEPQTVPGKFAGTMSEMVPGAGRRLITQAMMPGIASEAAGQVAESVAPDYAPLARGVGAVAGGIAGAPFQRASSAEAAIRQNLAGNVDQATINQATQLMDDAAAIGVRLTWAEAIERVAPGAGLTNLQRVVESSKGGREVMAPMFAARPGQIDAAAGQTFDTIAHAAPNPSAIGPAVGRAAEDQIEGVRGIINRASEPFYTAAAAERIPAAQMGLIRRTPGWREARDAVRNDPQLARYVRGLPDNSIGFVDEVKKYLNAAAEHATQPVGAQGRNMQRSAGYSSDAQIMRDTAVDVSRTVPGNPYETALNIQSQGREQFLQPLIDGPLGKLAKRDITTQNAIDTLFPKNPLANSAAEIEQTMRALAQRHPYAALSLLRAHAESVFNEATRNLQGGANQFGGARFAKDIAGNPQQRANLEAAVRASGPNGDDVWQGFERFLDIVQATGTRQQIGSKTAFNAQDLKDLSSGGLMGNAAKTGASPSKWLSVVSDAWSRWQLGGNLTELAHILTDPNSRRILTQIIDAPVGSTKGLVLAGQLSRMFVQGSGDAGANPTSNSQAPRK
jgi:hypothetical protein